MNNRIRNEIREYGIARMVDGVGIDQYGCDLHHEIFNMDYFIIGSYRAKEFLGNEVFDAIEEIKNYEQENFGQVSTDLSDPEKVVNMLAYIIGEEMLNESNHLHEKWDEKLTTHDLAKIATEISTEVIA